MNNFTNSQLVKWFTSHAPEDNLASWLRKKRTKELNKQKNIIRQTAYRLWEEDGKPNRDSEYYWFKAIQKLNSETTSGLLFSKLIRLGYSIEKPLEKGLAFLKSLAILGILEKIGNITFLIALIGFILTEKQRRDAEVYQAWQTITAAHDQSGSGGRKEALEFLNSEPKRSPWFWLTWERQSLAGLAAPNAYLEEVNLQGAQLQEANLQGARLQSAQLQKAKLYGANLQGARLQSAQLQKAKLGSAQLQKAVLSSAKLQNTKLYRANLEEANLEGSNLHKAILSRANLEEANLEEANLEEANLYRANLKEANLEGSNLHKAILSRANLQGTYLGEVKKNNYYQIKSACFWEQAIYKGQWYPEDKTIIEPENINFVEKLKKDSSSDPKNPPNCSSWNK